MRKKKKDIITYEDAIKQLSLFTIFFPPVSSKHLSQRPLLRYSDADFCSFLEQWFPNLI